jgi:hypothetical protein
MFLQGGGSGDLGVLVVLVTIVVVVLAILFIGRLFDAVMAWSEPLEDDWEDEEEEP